MPDPIRQREQEFEEVQRALAGQYSLQRELGRGGMGVVYLAREVELDRFVAIKVLPIALSMRADMRERFVREARASARLSHPNIVPIFRVGEQDGIAFFSMGYVDGESLGERLRERGVLPSREVTRILRDVSWALAYAHAQGVVHRDVKPDNILIERDTERVLVTDFGIAALEDAASNITGAHEIVGTAQYMSPEQASSGAIDGRADLYSLGIIGFLASTGRLPFDGRTTAVVIAKQVSEPAPSMAHEPGVPAQLAAVIDRALRKDPAERFANGESMAEALGESGGGARRLPPALRIWVDNRDPMRVPYTAWSFALGFATVVQFMTQRGGGLETALLAALPIIPHLLFRARQTRRVLSAGHSVEDMQFALAEVNERRREEMTIELHEGQTPALKLLRMITTAVVVADVGVLIGMQRILHMLDKPFVHQHSFALRVAFATMGILTFILVPTSMALGVPLLGRRFKNFNSGTLRERLWQSPLAITIAKWLRPRNSRPAAAFMPQPTEVALGSAAGNLYAALPKAARDQFPELLDVVSGLEDHAAQCRVRIQELDLLYNDAFNETAVSRLRGVDPLSDDTGIAAQRKQTVDDLDAARGAARSDLARTVAALESIRLDLLKMHAGSDASRQIATSIQAAQELKRGLEIALSARHEVSSILRRPVAAD
jgi:eukaryotic-like serine/threonine-protein kinase